MGTTPASSCLRSTTPPSDDGREYAAFPEGCEYAAFPEGEEDQQQHVVYNPQPATARGLQPLLAALCGLQPLLAAACGLQPLAAPVRGLHPQPAAIHGLQPPLAGRGGDTGGGGDREEGLRKTRSIPWLEYSSPRSRTASRQQPCHVPADQCTREYCALP